MAVYLCFFVVLFWLLFLPGLLTQVCFLSRRSLATRRDGLETLFVSLLFSLCLTGWVGLVLVEFSAFSLLRLLALVGAYCLCVLWLLRGRWGALRDLWDIHDRSTWALAVLVVIVSVLYFRPHEYILGGSDAGVYVNLGAHITRTGGLVFRDPDIAALDPAVYPALFRQQPPAFITRYIQFPGFYLSDQQAGVIIPQFYPLHPLWMAVFYSLGGLRASLYATPLWGALGVLAVGLTAKTLFGRRVGLLAAILLALNATQIWFARYPTSEALTQLLLYGGIYAFSRYMADESPEMGALAGLCLGQVMLVRLDTYFLLAIPVLLAAYLRLTRQMQKRYLTFLFPFLALSAHSVLHGFFQSWPYLHNSYDWQIARLPLPFLAGAAAAVLVGFLVLDRWAGGCTERLAWLARWVQHGVTILAVLTVVAALYAYFIRPQQADLSAGWENWYSGGMIPTVEPYNLVRLGWYLSPLGIALAVLGVWWMLRRELSRQTALFLGVGLFFSFLYIQNSRNNPHHIYVMRRYVPAVIPAFTIAAAYAVGRGWRRRNHWRRLALAAAAVQVGLLLYAGRVIWRQTDYHGLVDQLTPWVESIPSDAVVLFNDDLPVSIGATIGTPLRYLFNRTVFDLQEEYVTPEVLGSLISHWQAQNRPILLAVGPNSVREPFVRWTLAPSTGLWLDSKVLENTYFHFPQEIWHATTTLEVYEIRPGALAFPLRIDVGMADWLYLGDGWHGKERLPDGATVRWTGGAARIQLLALATTTGDVQLRMRMAAPSPAGRTPVEVRLLSGKDTVVRWQVGTAFAEYEIVAPVSALAHGLVIETEVWNPAALGLGTDTRDLGVMVDWISIE